jgi:hypothetical protein
VNVVVALVDILLNAALIAAGFHQHHRGAWRRRRDKQLV